MSQVTLNGAKQQHKFGRELEKFAKQPDIKSATRLYLSDYKYTKGQVWSFWMEDDPRFEDGINYIAKYRCIVSGDANSEWLSEETQ